MKNDLQEKYLSIIEDNVNVGKSNDWLEFLTLIGGIVGICLIIYVFADISANIFINTMSDKTQMKIEKAISFNSKPNIKTDDKNIKKLETIRDRIVKMDKNLQNKSTFPIEEVNNKNINAFITSDGSIYFTSGLLKEIQDEEVLAFVMAHELGHYAHRDHLKGISRQIIASILISILTSSQQNMSITVDNISNLTGLKYSRAQERDADKYASNAVIKLYGTNEGAVEFFKLLEKKQKIPEFLYYSSTHPATSQRIKMLKKENLYLKYTK